MSDLKFLKESEEIVKLYIVYINYDNSIYGWSTNKKYVNNFLKVRCKDVFHVKKFELPATEFSIFAYEQRKYQILTDNLWDGKRDYKIYCTMDESEILDRRIRDTEEVYRYLLESLSDKDLRTNLLNEKYYSAYEKLASLFVTSKEGFLPINTYQLFIYIFKFTFILNEEDYERRYI